MDFPECSFPVSICHHKKKPRFQRSNFADCGSFSQVDCYSQNDRQSIGVNCRPQKGMCTIDGLTGNLPPLPLYNETFSDNDLIHDHILGVDQYEDAIKSAKFVVDHLPYTKLHRTAEYLTRLKGTRALLDKCQSKATKHKPWSQLNEKFPPELKDLFRKYSSTAKAFNDNCMMGFNRDFYQGLLCHKQSSNSTILFHAAGVQFKDIYMTEVSLAEKGLPLGNQVCKVNLEEPIFQLNCSEEGLLCARQEKQCSVFTYDESNRCLNNLTHAVFKGKKLSDIEFSPYKKDELLVSATTGEVYLWSLDSGSRISLQKVPKKECAIPWSSSYFAGHPRQIVISDCFSMGMFDHRDNFRKGVELFHLSNSLVKSHECLMAAASLGFPYHVVATDYTLFVVDQRFPGSPVLQWSTENLNTPQYLKSCTLSNTGTDVNDGESEQFIFLGSQQPAEVLCYPLQLAKAGCAPVTTTLPWSVGKIGDFVQHENTSYTPQWFQIDKHYQSSLAGMTVVNHPKKSKHIISVYQLDGYGDIYFQDFKLAHGSGDSHSYNLVQPHLKKKAAADPRATSFLSTLDKTRVFDRRPKTPTSCISGRSSFGYSDVKNILAVKTTSSASKEELKQQGLNYSQFSNIDKTLVGTKALPWPGPNTRLLVALKEKADIRDVLLEREKDYDKKKLHLRQKYLALKLKERAKAQTKQKKVTAKRKKTK